MKIIPTRSRGLEDWPDTIRSPKIELPEELKPRYIWQYDIGYKKCRLVRERFSEMLELLYGKETIINDLKKLYSLRTSFSVGIHAQHDQHNLPELVLTKEIITFAASIEADIGFDMYFE